MPNLDKTGPRGQGPKTGLGQGDCADDAGTQSPRTGSATGRGMGKGFGWGAGFSRGFGGGGGQGFGRGFGRGMGRCFFGGLGGRMFWTKQDEQKNLEDYREDLKRELAGVEEALASKQAAKTAKK